ncbi:MAG TPA: CoA-binding protein [Spongiibacteraceae bacterium]
MSSVVVVGASANPDRIAHQAIERLLNKHYTVIPINPAGGEILGLKVRSSLGEIGQTVDTVTMYVGPERQSVLIDAIIRLKPRRVIFNPGAENPAVYARLTQAGIAVQEACTLVLLSTHQFDEPV